MTESANKKQVNTLLDRELHKEAVLHDINWARALELGVTLMLGGNKEEKELRQELTELHGREKYIETRLDEIARVSNARADLLDIIKNPGLRFPTGARGHNNPLAYMKATIDALENNRGSLEPRTRVWNSVTNMDMSQNEFLEACKRAEAGEFDNNGHAEASRGPKKKAKKGKKT